MEDSKLLIGGADGKHIHLMGKVANRHGMISGATGTGKTVTLQVLAEGFSKMGTPVFLADVKGDLSGFAAPCASHPKVDERIEKIGIEGYNPHPYPAVFWDLLGEEGHPIRTTISEMGPLLLSSLLELNDTQTGVLYSCFKIADDEGLLMLDLKDLRMMLNWVADNRKELQGEYGNFATATIGAIQRALLVLEEQGAENFFGEPALDIADLMKTDFSGNGVINVLNVRKLISRSPRLYATFLLWLLSELFEELPEVGDADKPKLVFFFDEAHLLFNRAPRVLLDKIEQVVRLIRSKGVGVFFISQSPLDVPESVLGQLGSRIQHRLNAYTPKDKKVVSTVAKTFRQNKNIDTEEAITNLATGEALVSVLGEKGSPTPVERVLICPPESKIGPVEDSVLMEWIGRSPMKGRYDNALDRESACELLKIRAKQQKAEEEADEKLLLEEKAAKKAAKKGSSRQSLGEAVMKTAARTLTSSISRRIVRGILGSIFGGRGR